MVRRREAVAGPTPLSLESSFTALKTLALSDWRRENAVLVVWRTKASLLEAARLARLGRNLP